MKERLLGLGQDAMSTLVQLGARHELTPERVVKEAEDPASPLHGHFPWDDTEAARRWRLHVAADLIRRVRIRIEVAGAETYELRAFISVEDDSGRAFYLNEAEVRASPRLRAKALEAMHAEWLALEVKWRMYEEFWKLIANAAKRRSRPAKAK